MAHATFAQGASSAGSRLTFAAPRPSMAGARGPEPRKGVNQRMDDLRKNEEVASTDVLFLHTLSGFQHWKPARTYQNDVPKCMAPLEGPLTVYVNRRGVAPTFQRDMGPVRPVKRGDKPPAAKGLPGITSKVPYFGHYGGAPWQESGKPHGALGYNKDERKKTKCRKLLGNCCTCFPQEGDGGVLRKTSDKEAGPRWQYGRHHKDDAGDEKGSGKKRDRRAKGDGRKSRDDQGDGRKPSDDKGPDHKSIAEGEDGEKKIPYDRAKAEYRTEKDLDDAEKSWGILEQILKMENEKREAEEEAARQQERYYAMWDQFDDVIETSDEEQTHVCLRKTKCIPRRCRIWRVGSQIKSSSSSEEEPEKEAEVHRGTGHHPHFSEADGGEPQGESTMPETEGTENYDNEDALAGSIRRSSVGPAQEGYPSTSYGSAQDAYPAPYGSVQDAYPAPYGSRQGSYVTNAYYVQCRAIQDFRRPSEQRKRAPSRDVCKSDPPKHRSAECKRKKLCDPPKSAKQHRKPKDKAKRKRPCSRKKHEKRSRRRRGDPPSGCCGRPNCRFSNRLTYPVEMLPYSASQRHVACNPEHPAFQLPTVSCPIKWDDIRMGQL